MLSGVTDPDHLEKATVVSQDKEIFDLVIFLGTLLTNSDDK